MFGGPNSTIGDVKLNFVVGTLVVAVIYLKVVAISADPSVTNAGMPALLVIRGNVKGKFVAPLVSVLVVLNTMSATMGVITTVIGHMSSKLGGQALSNGGSMSTKAPGTRAPSVGAEGHVSSHRVVVTLVYYLVSFNVTRFKLLALVRGTCDFLTCLTVPIVLIPCVVRVVIAQVSSGWDGYEGGILLAGGVLE